MPSNRRPHATARGRRKPGSDLCPAQTPRKAKPFQCGPRLTLIRPPVVNRESSPAAGCFPREKDTTWGPRGAADFISRAASDTVVCTKHLLRLELETTTCSRHQRGEQPRLRGLETHLCPPAGRLKATGSG